MSSHVYLDERWRYRHRGARSAQAAVLCTTSSHSQILNILEIIWNYFTLSMHLGQNYHNIMLFVILNNSRIETTLNITPQLHLSLLGEDLAAYYIIIIITIQIQSNLNFIKFGTSSGLLSTLKL